VVNVRDQFTPSAQLVEAIHRILPIFAIFTNNLHKTATININIVSDKVQLGELDARDKLRT